jgi:hypothetical protein
MLQTLRRAAVCAGLAVSLGLLGGTALAQAPQDVPREHWAYAAVDDLAGKGLIKGYPPNGDFFGKRTVTRYEMAVVVQRILARMDELLGKKADKGESVPAAGVKPEQLDEVRRLVSEYKTELTVIGTDLQKVKDQIGELNTKVDAAQRSADDAKAAAAKAAADAMAAKDAANKADKAVKDVQESGAATQAALETLTGDVKAHKISGYIQGRFEAFDRGESSIFTKSGSGGTGQTPTNGGPSVGGPYYGFLVRRARLKLSGPISTRTDYTLQVDAASIGAVAVKDAFIGVSNFLGPNVKGTFGLFPPPFGTELPHSSSTRESPERAFGFSDSTAAGAMFKTSVNATGGTITAGSVVPLFIGQDRDTGAAFTYSAPGKSGTKLTLGAFNGEGRGASGVRNLNNHLDAVARAQTTLLGGNLDLGVSGYYGALAVRGGPPAGTPPAPVGFKQAFRVLGGADMRYFSPWGTTFRAEYMGGLYEMTPDRAQYLQGNHAQAWYVTARHPLSKRLDFAVKYDEFMPISMTGHTAAGLGRAQLIRKTLQGGFLYYIDDATRLRLWYSKGLTPYDPSAVSGPLRSRLGLITGEVQVVF